MDECGEKQVKMEIEKLTNEIVKINCAIEELSKAKDYTECKLKDEIKKAQDLCKWKNVRIDRNNSQTLQLLNVLSVVYEDMLCLHRNCELHSKTEETIESYRKEFEGLISLHEKLVVGFFKAPKRRSGCPCQMRQEAENNKGDAIQGNGVAEESTNTFIDCFIRSTKYPCSLICSEVEEEMEEETKESVETCED